MPAQKRHRVSQDSAMDPGLPPGSTNSGAPNREALPESPRSIQSGLIVPFTDEEQLATFQDPADHKWDDVLRAIDEDLRAFWGLWETVIAPRIDANLPRTLHATEGWNVDDVDVTNVWHQLERMQSLVMDLISRREPKPEEGRVLASLGRFMVPYKEKGAIYLRLFIVRITTFAQVPGIVYPMPVN